MKRVILLTALLAPLLSAQAPDIARTPEGKPDFTGFWNLPYVPKISLAVYAENQEPQYFQIRPTYQESSTLLHRKWVDLAGILIVEN